MLLRGEPRVAGVWQKLSRKRIEIATRRDERAGKNPDPTLKANTHMGARGRAWARTTFPWARMGRRDVVMIASRARFFLRALANES